MTAGRVTAGCALGLAAAAGLLFGGGLTGVALVALAGIAGLVATSGIPRRVVGLLLGVAGVLAAVSAVPLVIAGGVVLAVTGVAVLVLDPRLARIGARYSRAPDPDPDRAAWTALDEGRDPTSERPGGAV